MSVRVLPHASVPPARGATPSYPRGARKNTLEHAQRPPERARRRIRDDARDGLAAAAVSLGGSIAVTLTLGLLLRWLG